MASSLDRDAVQGIVQDREKRDRANTLGAAGADAWLVGVGKIPNVGAFNVKVDASAARLPGAEVDLVLDPVSIFVHQIEGEKIALAGLKAFATLHAFNQGRQLLGERPATLVEDALVVLVIVAQGRVVLLFTFDWQAFGEAVVAEGDPDGVLLERLSGNERTLKCGRIGVEVAEVARNALVGEVGPGFHGKGLAVVGCSCHCCFLNEATRFWGYQNAVRSSKKAGL